MTEGSCELKTVLCTGWERGSADASLLHAIAVVVGRLVGPGCRRDFLSKGPVCIRPFQVDKSWLPGFFSFRHLFETLSIPSDKLQTTRVKEAIVHFHDTDKDPTGSAKYFFGPDILLAPFPDWFGPFLLSV